MSREVKSEIRRPNSEGIPNAECGRLSLMVTQWPLFRYSGFGFPSDFGLRISDFFRHSSFVIRRSELINISYSCADNLIRSRQSGLRLADAVLSESAHAHFPGACSQHRRGHLLIDQFARF